MNPCSKNKGAAALPTILLIGSIILEIVIALALIAYVMLQAGAGARQSAEALTFAQSGVDDAIMKLLRDNAYSTGINNSSYYTLSFEGNKQTQVSVCQNTKYNFASSRCDVINNGEIEVIATGRSSIRGRRLRALLIIDPSTNQVLIKSLEEIPLNLTGTA